MKTAVEIEMEDLEDHLTYNTKHKCLTQRKVVGGDVNRVARTFPVSDYKGATHPLFSGPMSYFPDALLAIAELCKVGNDQHNPDMPLHWSRDISSEHLDKAVGHILQAGNIDSDKVRHTTKAAWRLLAELQLEIEDARRSQHS